MTAGCEVPSSHSDSGAAKIATAPASTVVTASSTPVAVRASARRRSTSASRKWKRTSASPTPRRATIETRITVVTSSSAVP
jgi:hypothetical protein